MFSSISSCSPNSSVSTGFTSTKQQILNAPVDIDIYVNGDLISSRPIELSVDDLVEASVISPADYLDHEFYQYTLDGLTHVFAVVNKNLYQPTVKTTEEQKKWFNYNSTTILVDFYKDNLQRPLGNGKNFVDIKNTHIVLDHINFAVCFYSTSQELITRVPMTASPIEYRKISIADPVTGIEKVEALILCGDRRLYRIRFDNQYDSSDAYTPTVIPVNFFDNLWFEADLPNGASLLDLRRKNLRSKLNPLVTALDIGPDNIWIGGYDNVWILQKNFQFIKSVSIPNETVICLACIDNNAIATTRTGKIYYIKFSGGVELLYTQSALGIPYSFNNYQSVAVPDPNNQQLLIFNTNGMSSTPSRTNIPIPDAAPAYVRNFDDRLWITSHDNNRVVQLDTNTLEISNFDFDHKVTLVSVVNNNILTVQYHQDQVILDLTGIKKVIPFKLQSRTGSITHVGTEPVLIKMLGEESITPIAGPDINCWINGSTGVPLNTGDYLGISFKATKVGLFRRSTVVGEHAFDYDVEIKLNRSINEFYVPNLVTTGNINFSLPYQSKLVPDTGNLKNGSSTFNLPFDFNIFGNTYSTINVSTTGVVTFANTVITEKPTGFGNLGTDALYIEFGNLYQGRPLDNKNPLNVTVKSLTSGEIPGIYYTSGSINGFDYFKFRWVGIESYKLERYATTVTGVVSSYSVPVDSVSDIEIGDYISAGTSITVSTRVTGKNSVYEKAEVAGYTTYTNSTGTDFVRLKLKRGTANVNYASLYSTIVPYATVESDITGNIGYISGGVAQEGWGFYYRNPSNALYDPFEGTVREISGNVITVYTRLFSYVTNETIVRLPLVYSDGSVEYQNIYTLKNVNRYFYTVQILATKYGAYVISQADYDKLAIGMLIRSYNFTFTTLTYKALNVDGDYTIYWYGPYASFIYIELTDLTFESNILPLAFDPVKNQSPIISTSEPLYYYNYYIDLVDKTTFDTGNITISGNFVSTDKLVTISANTSIMFNQDIDTSPLTYEVGIYSNKYYQFVEYYYNNTKHQSTTNVGISSGGIESNIANINPGRSGLFYSDSGTGNWKFFGDGHLDTGLKLYPAIRNFVPLISRTEFPTQARIEFTIDQDFTVNDQIIISSSYGELTVNNGVYTGLQPVVAHNIVSLTVPVNNSLRIVAPIITIGNEQFTVPMITSTVQTPLNEIVYFYPNQSANVSVSTTIIVPITDTYYLPDYYKSFGRTIDNTATFKLVRDGIETILTPGAYYDLNAGDELSIMDLNTAPGLYDSRVIDIVGSFVLRFIWETDPGPKFDTLTFDTLIDPIIGNDVYTFSTVNNDVFVDREKFLTANITLTGAGAQEGAIYVDDLLANIIIDGTVYGDYVSNARNGSNIAIQRQLFNYYQTSANIYQVKFDSVTNSNVYIPIGRWDISNKIISGSLLEDNISSLNRNLLNNFSTINNIVSDSTLDPIFSRSPGVNLADKKQSRYELSGSDPFAKSMTSLRDSTESLFKDSLELTYFKNTSLTAGVSSLLDNTYFYGAYSFKGLLSENNSIFTRRVFSSYVQHSEFKSRSILPYFSNWGLIVGKAHTPEASGFTSFNGIGAKHQYITSGVIFEGKTTAIYANTKTVSGGNIRSQYDSVVSLFKGKTLPIQTGFNIFDVPGISSEYLQTNYTTFDSISSQWDSFQTFIDTEKVTSLYDNLGTFIDTSKIVSGGYIPPTYMTGQIDVIDFYSAGNELYGHTDSIGDKQVNYLVSSIKSKNNLFYNLIKAKISSAHNRSPLEFFTKIAENPESKNTLSIYGLDSDVVKPISNLKNKFTPSVLSKETLEQITTRLTFIKQFSELFSQVNQLLTGNPTINFVDFEETAVGVSTQIKSSMDHKPVNQPTELITESIAEISKAISALNSSMDRTLQHPISLVSQLSDWEVAKPISSLNAGLKIKGNSAASELIVKNTSAVSGAISTLTAVLTKILTAVASNLIANFESAAQTPFADLKYSLEKISETVQSEMTNRFSREFPDAISELISGLEKIVSAPNSETTSALEKITPSQLSELVTGLSKVVESVSSESSFLLGIDIADGATEIAGQNESNVEAVYTESFKLPEYNQETTASEMSDAHGLITDTVASESIYDPEWLFLTKVSEALLSNKNILDQESAVTLTKLIEVLEGTTASVSDDLSPIKDGTTASISGLPTVLLEGTTEQVKWINYEYLVGALGQVKWINTLNLIGTLGQVQWYNGHLLETQPSTSLSFAANIIFENHHTEFRISTAGTELITQGGSFVYPGGIASLFQVTEAMGFRNQIVLVKDIPYLLPYRHILLTQTMDVSPVYGPKLFQPIELFIKTNLLLWKDLLIEKGMKYYFEPPIERIKQLINVLDDEPERPRPLVLELDTPPERPLINELVLDQEVIWTMEVIPESGAYQTFINIWADNGRNGDLVTTRGNDPTFIMNGPMVQYTKEYKYAPGGYKISDFAENESVKYYSAGIMKIPMTDYWNYRIYFNTRHYCVPKKGILFPVNWYVRGG